MSLSFDDFEPAGFTPARGPQARLAFVPLLSVGSRYEYTTSEGERVGVLVDEEGRRSLLIGSRDDPDPVRTIALDEEDRLVLLDLLGNRDRRGGSLDLLSALASVKKRVEGLVVCSVPLRRGSHLAGRPIAATLPRGAEVSVVAVRREGGTEPATRDTCPGPGDTLVVVGSPVGVRRFLDVCERDEPSRNGGDR